DDRDHAPGLARIGCHQEMIVPRAGFVRIRGFRASRSRAPPHPVEDDAEIEWGRVHPWPEAPCEASAEASDAEGAASGLVPVGEVVGCFAGMASSARGIGSGEPVDAWASTASRIMVPSPGWLSIESAPR